MTIQRYDCHVGLYTYGMKKEVDGVWVRYEDAEREIKALQREIEQHLDARFRATEAHVTTMGKLVEALAELKVLEDFKDKIDGAGGYP